MLKRVGFLKFAEYSEYVKACQDDKTIEQLSEANNMYRTLLSLFLFLGGLFLIEAIVTAYPNAAGFLRVSAFVVLTLLFLFSYRKQTRYVTGRITAVRDEGN